jgi:SAM-dependent methyltransferase
MSLLKRIHGKFRRSVLGARLPNYPSNLTSRGISRTAWERIQHDHELNYWVHEYPTQVPAGKTPAEYHAERAWVINRRMFKSLEGTNLFENKIVLDVGCGPYGSVDFSGARTVVGVDPLGPSYRRHCEITPGLIILSADAERLPLLDDSFDVVISINALDHFHHPYDALEEMWRVCRPGGRFLLATDIEGTPRHPVKIRRAHLDEFFAHHRFTVVQQDAGLHLENDWPREMEIPLYVFDGFKQQEAEA